MTFREEVENLSLVLVEGERSGTEVNIYERIKNDLGRSLEPKCAEFASKLLSWVCRDGTEFKHSELEKLDKLNLAYTNNEGKRKIVFIGCSDEYPEELAMIIDYLIYNGKISYVIEDEKIKFEMNDT